MKRSRVGLFLSACAGLLAGPLAWAVSTQIGQILPYVDCARGLRYSAIVSWTAAGIAMLASVPSWRSAHGILDSGTDFARTLRFVSALSVLSTFLFAFALAMQGAASLVLTGCER